MKVLAFDCSTSRGSLAVVEDGATIFAKAFDCPRGRGGEFFLVLERAMKVARPGRIVVGIGPGSYNGLRTAISAAEGLRLATGAELLGVASVRGIPCDGPMYAAIGDARGGVFSYAKVCGRELADEFELLDLAALEKRLEGLTIPVFASAHLPAFPQAVVAAPDAAILAELDGGTRPDGTLEPLYLKPAHITQPKPAVSRRPGK